MFLERFHVPLGWPEILKRTIYDAFMRDDVSGYAGELAYFGFLALFPALLFLVALLSFFPVHGLIDRITATLGQVAPPDIITLVTNQLKTIGQQQNTGLLTIGILGTIWSASSGMSALVDVLNHVYRITDSRPYWKSKGTAILLTIAVGIFVVISFALVVAGPAIAGSIANRVGLGEVFTITWRIAELPVAVFFVIFGVALIYYFAPDAEQDWVLITPGSIAATIVWIAGSLGFRWYVASFSSYNKTYGAIGGIIIALLWLYISSIAILLGAELNAEIEHASPFGKEPGEKLVGQKKKKIGVRALRQWEREHPGETAATLAVASHPNCELDRPRRGAPAPAHRPRPAAARQAATDRRWRASELVVGGLVLSEFAWKVWSSIRRSRVEQ